MNNNEFSARTDAEKVFDAEVTRSCQTIAKPTVSGSLLGLDEVKQPFQDALYATGRFSTEQCEQLTDGLLQYIDDAGLAVVRQ